MIHTIVQVACFVVISLILALSGVFLLSLAFDLATANDWSALLALAAGVTCFASLSVAESLVFDADDEFEAIDASIDDLI